MKNTHIITYHITTTKNKGEKKLKQDNSEGGEGGWRRVYQ